MNFIVNTYDSLRSIIRILERASPCVLDTLAVWELNFNFGNTERQQSTLISWARANCHKNICSTVSHCKLFSGRKTCVL